MGRFCAIPPVQQVMSEDTVADIVIERKATRPLERSARHGWFSHLLPYLMIAPTLGFVFVFTLYPAVQSVIASLYRPGRRGNPDTFVGLQNYIDLFTPSHFIGADFTRVFSNTLFFAVMTVMLSVPLALMFALLLNRKICGMGFWRFSIFYPALLPVIGAASLWAFLFADTIGVVSVIFKTFGISNPNWLGDPNTVLWVVTLVNVWKQASFYMIFFLAGLQAIPRDIYEAASIDGANGEQKLRTITIPLLRRTFLFVIIMAFVMAFQTVEQLAALGQGGPGVSSNLVLYYIYQRIPERLNWGYVNAMTVILLIVLMAFTVSSLVFFERGGRESDRE